MGMTFMVLAVICSVLLGFIFKLFVKYNINGFQAIVFNYLTCVACGTIHLGHFPLGPSLGQTKWIGYALLLGFVFITGFNTAMMTVRQFSVTLSQVMQKMSILLSVPFAVWAYQESSGTAKVMGFVMAIFAIVLVNWPKQKPHNRFENPQQPGMLLLPIVTWIFAGIIEIVFIKVERDQLVNTADPTFIITVFGTAGCLGLCMLCWQFIRKTNTFSWRNVAAGIVLGIPNYGSMLFMLWALNTGMEGSFLFPVANIGIILFTTIGAVMLFREKLSNLNWAGIVLAVLAIGLMSYQ